MFAGSKSYNRQGAPGVSAAYVLMTETEWYPVLMEAIDKGWVKDYNEQEPENQASLLVNYLGSLEDLIGHNFNYERAPETAKENPEGEQVALELLAKGADPWLATKPLPFFLQNNLYSVIGQPNSQAPDFEETVDGFDQAVHTGCSELVEQILSRREKSQRKANQVKASEVGASELMARGAVVFERKSSHKIRLPYLHATVRNGMLKTAGVLLSHGFDVEQRDLEGRTALFHATSLEALDFLLGRGAKAIVKDKNGKLPSAEWRKMLPPSTANEMARHYQEVMLNNVDELEEEEKLEVVQARAREILAKGQRSTLVKLVKGAGLKMEDLTFAGCEEGRRESLLYRASMILLEKNDIPFHGVALGLDLKQGATETIPGIPDAFWAYQALANSTRRAGASAVMDQAKRILVDYCQQHHVTGGTFGKRTKMLWITKASWEATEPALKNLGNSPFENEVLECPSPREQEEFGLRADPLCVQFLYNQSKQVGLASTNLLSLFTNASGMRPGMVTDKKYDHQVRKTLAQSPLFWKAAGYNRQGTSTEWYFQRVCTEMWQEIKEEDIAGPIGIIATEDIAKLLEPGGIVESCKEGGRTFAKAWVNRWMLKEAEATVVAERNQNKPASAKMRL